MKHILLAFFLSMLCLSVNAEDGYQLWLRYKPVSNQQLLTGYKKAIAGLSFYGNSSTINITRLEMKNALSSMLGKSFIESDVYTNNSIVIGEISKLPVIAGADIFNTSVSLSLEGFLIKTFETSGKKITVITAKTDVAVLYGVFHFLRLIQTGQSISGLNITSSPKIKLRLLNHWDNLNRHVERGYAGQSIWDWHRLPGYIDQKYIDYARANASIGINGSVLTNVNANAMLLTPQYLEKVTALANVFRPYGIKVYLTARFSAPIEIGKLKTADPLDTTVQNWWKQKVAEIYKYIPDFGGFLVKANSEGQPGPQNYNRTHADGANMLADAVAPFGGIVMWRSFVYSNEQPEDRFKQAYTEFKPLDGKFDKNVLVQVKNGPIDFQPREPYSPLFGAMPATPLMIEFQLTQEYLGQATHLVFEPPMFKRRDH